MKIETRKKRTASRAKTLRLPDLEQAKKAVVNSLASESSQRSYKRAIDEFIRWYCSEPRLAFNRAVVRRYKTYLKERNLAASTINVHLAAVRRLAHEAADNGLLSPELVAGIDHVKGAKSSGRRIGNWLTAEQGQALLTRPASDDLRGLRDRAVVAVLIGCGLRRAELVELRMESLQTRENHWIIADLVGKGQRVRTVPMPDWVKSSVDNWTRLAGITSGKIFRRINRHGGVWGEGLSAKVVWHVIRQVAQQSGIP